MLPSNVSLSPLPTSMKWSSVFLSLLFSYFVAAQSDVLPLPPTSTSSASSSTSPSSTSSSRSTTSASSSVSSASSDTSRSTSSTSSTSLPPSRTTSTEVLPTSPGRTTIRSSDIVVTLTNSASPSATSSAVPPPPSPDSGLGTGSIIGLSVAGGVAVIGVVAFFIWKFTRKRFTDFDDNEAIKWPDLNTHGSGNVDSHPLPVKNTGRSGFDTGSDGDLSLANNYSTPDFNQNIAPDPYAVPPLPHLNPNQPYRDDPGSGYYDPYHGPIPGTIENGVPTPPPDWGTEAIPMTQMGVIAGAGPGGRNSPAPQMPYDLGRQSPGPYVAYDAHGGVSGRLSPGPHLAYNTGSISPAPGASRP